MTAPRCQCCMTGAEFIARHVDPANQLPLDVNAFVLATETWQGLNEFDQAAVPSLDAFVQWVVERQRQLSAVRRCA